MKKTYFLCFLVVCVTFFIWHNSLQDAANSEEASLFFVALVKKFLTGFQLKVATGNLDHTLRKLAHLSEFTVLGYCLAAVMMHLTRDKVSSSVLNALGFGFVIAATDELLQIFSIGRACELRDVGLDLLGVILGVAVYYVARWVGRNVFG